ncbi:MAG: hypothetical protein Q8M44_07905, partial [bacterium]|nr:hypothetical protein [bacterium]
SSIIPFQKSFSRFSTLNSYSKSFIIDFSYLISHHKFVSLSQDIINILSKLSDVLSFLFIYIHTNVSSNIGFHILKTSQVHTGFSKSSRKYHSNLPNSFTELASKSTSFHQLFNFLSFILTKYVIFIFGIFSTVFSIIFQDLSTSDKVSFTS